MRVLMLTPGFPAEMPIFTRALAQTGVEVFGVGEQEPRSFPEDLRAALAGYRQISTILREEQAFQEIVPWARALELDRIECLWEPGVLLAARLREALQLPGMTLEQTIPFRDKEEMKRKLDAANIRTPRHDRARTARECRDAADRIGYPLIIKPIAGAGSMDTYRVNDDEDYARVLDKLRHVPEVSVEEFVEGEEYTFDTICANGEVLFENMCWYRPNALISRSEEWISPQTVCLRDLERPELQVGRQMGHAVLEALGFQTGFTHMEWFRHPDGQAVFGEIACRPPGARTVDVMAQTCDGDVFRAWAEAAAFGRLEHPLERRFNAAVIFKRAQGQGRIAHIEGLDDLRRSLGDALVGVDLLPVGAQRRNWRATLLSDGFLTVRHPDLPTLTSMADRVGTELRLYAR